MKQKDEEKKRLEDQITLLNNVSIPSGPTTGRKPALISMDKETQASSRRDTTPVLAELKESWEISLPESTLLIPKRLSGKELTAWFGEEEKARSKILKKEFKDLRNEITSRAVQPAGGIADRYLKAILQRRARSSSFQRKKDVDAGHLFAPPPSPVRRGAEVCLLNSATASQPFPVGTLAQEASSPHPLTTATTNPKIPAPTKTTATTSSATTRTSATASTASTTSSATAKKKKAQAIAQKKKTTPPALQRAITNAAEKRTKGNNQHRRSK